MVNNTTVEQRKPLISLAPLETMTIFFMVCLVTGLVIASPWVFYQVWAFVAAGLYRHERHYVTKFLPFSLGLFLSGVFLCFFGVLPITLSFLLEFNVWLGIEPTLRLSDWMSFATILPLVFGLCFQTPLIMLFLAWIGIFTAADFRAKRKFADPDHRDRRRGADAGAGPVQPAHAGRADDRAVRAGHHARRRPGPQSGRQAEPCRLAIVCRAERIRLAVGFEPDFGMRAGWLGPGIVYLVGAGPGDPGLLTRRAPKALARADVVVYDHLASPRLLDLAPASALRICAGKSVGHCTMSQEEINDLLVEHAREGRGWSGSRGATRSSSAGGPRRPSTCTPRGSRCRSCRG